MRALLLALAATILCAACATNDPERESDTDSDEGWKDDWNERVDASESRTDHPCGDFVFDSWAEDFLSGCEPGSSSACDHRHTWVWARSQQCDEWQQYLLRNHFQHVRRDDIPEPDMHLD